MRGSHTHGFSSTSGNPLDEAWGRSGFDSRHQITYQLNYNAWDFIRLALSSVAKFAIFPVQDVLSVGTEARMNFPGRPEGNWAWRVLPEQLDPAHTQCLSELTRTYGRSQADQ